MNSKRHTVAIFSGWKTQPDKILEEINAVKPSGLSYGQHKFTGKNAMWAYTRKPEQRQAFIEIAERHDLELTIKIVNGAEIHARKRQAAQGEE